MINILSHVGMNIQSEVCLWTLLGLLRTTFDPTLFKVNANLKQVWQMSMPGEISLPVQRVLRTMISGIMLVQCFTVYVYIASYIVLLYPAFLEERPTLVLPWLLLAAIRKLLCELMSLALGLATCLLVGAACPPCIIFVVYKISSILPSVYIWLLVLSYYNTLRVASVFQTFPTAVPGNDLDYGLELAIRRRRTKSLFGEEQLRKRLLSSWYVERPHAVETSIKLTSPLTNIETPQPSPSDTSKSPDKVCEPNTFEDYKISSIIGLSDDWFGPEMNVPRNCDRIAEQIALMLLRISSYLRKSKNCDIPIFESRQQLLAVRSNNNRNLDICSPLTHHTEDNPHFVGSSKENKASYIRLYPQIFMKEMSESQSMRDFENIRTVRSPSFGFSETSQKNERDVKSVDKGNNSICFNEKLTTSQRLSSVQELDGLQKINRNNENQQIKIKTNANINTSQEVNEMKSDNRSLSVENMSLNSEDSLLTLLTKMEKQLSEIIALRNRALSNDGPSTFNYSSIERLDESSRRKSDDKSGSPK